MEIFNEQEWREKIKNPLWYMEVPLFMKKLIELRSQDKNKYEEVKENIYKFFEKELSLGNVALGDIVKDFDKERQDIDMIIIHHTHGENEMTNERLSAMELLRLYAPYFANPTYEPDKIIQGKSIYSGHFRNGKQVFWPYQWIVRKDGKVEQLLLDNEIGWHAGKWDINCRSIAIAFDGNYENSTPSEVELQSAAKLIMDKYPYIKKEMIFGHREVNQKTTCPSNLFLSQDGGVGWKEDLLKLI